MLKVGDKIKFKKEAENYYFFQEKNKGKICTISLINNTGTVFEIKEDDFPTKLPYKFLYTIEDIEEVIK